jgi:branched-chain amino acid transport system ATP-binding protein
MLVIGRALMGNPSILLFDEPFLGLSLDVRDRILSVIEGTLKNRVTILLAEHDLGAARRVLDRYCIFLNGEMIHQAKAGDITDEEKMRSVFRRFYQSGAVAGPRADGKESNGEKR